MTVRTTLADGRELLFFSLPGHTPAPVADRRPLPPFEPGQSQLRFDQTTGQWVIIAARRQDRTYKPPPDQCPLCPGPTGETSEVPAPDYDVVVFENRFPSLSGAGPVASVPDGFVAAPGVGRCEVICFSRFHTPGWWSRRGGNGRGSCLGCPACSRCSASRIAVRRSA
jgi:UDPglucose--hexose-1-phosphate uridylyltransferase